MEHPAFVVGVCDSVLSVVRTLGAHGVACWTCSPRRIPGTVSRYSHYWRVPDPQFDERGTIAGILELASRVGGRPVIFAAGDHFAQAIARHRDELASVAIPCVAPSEVVELLLQKQRFCKWAEEHVRSFPRSMLATEFSPGGSIPFPVVAKPYYRSFSNAAELGIPLERELFKRRFALIRNLKEWEAYRREHSEFLRHILVQEYVNGTSASKYTVGIYADQHSEIKGLFVGRTVRGFPARYGNGSLIQSDHVPECVIDEVKQAVKSLQYSTIADFDYFRDDVTGEFRLLEINPRSWSWIGIATITDANIPWIAYQDLTGQRPHYTEHTGTPGSVKMVLLGTDLSNVFIRYRKDYPPGVLSPAEWRQSLRAEKLLMWELNSKDWLGSAWCLLVVLLRSVRYVLRSGLRRVSSMGRRARSLGTITLHRPRS